MRLFFVLLAFVFLPCLAFATDANSDSNAFDANSADLNVFRGPISLSITFQHTVIGSSDLNAKGWVFTGSEDFAFSIDVPNLSKMYFLDFEEKKAFVYEQGIVPVGWNYLIEANEPFSFEVTNLLGDAKPDLFLLIDDGINVNVEHLDASEAITVVPQKLTRYFLLIDADAFGSSSFSLEIEGYVIGASVKFLQLPSVWEYVERFGMACTDNPEHRCLVMPGGSQFDFDACIDPEAELNKVVGEAPPLETCVAGSDAYRQWREDTLQRRLELEQEKRKSAEEKTNPELANQVAGLISAFASFKDAEGLQSQEDLDRYVSVGAAVFIFLAFFGVGFVVNRKALPIQPIVYGVKQSVMKKFEEAKSNGFWKGKEEELHKPVAGGEPVAEAEAGAGAVGSAAAVGAAGSAGAAPFRWVKRGKGGH